VKGELRIEIPMAVAGHPTNTKVPVCDDWRNKVLEKALDKSFDEGAIAILKSNWGKYAAGSVTTVGVAGACLFLGPPGWVAAAGISAVSLTSIAATIGAIALSKYQNHKGKVEAIKTEIGGAAQKK